MAREYLLELEHICKSFKDVKANDDINLKLKEGEVLALLGENGAGKSTLMNIIYGIYHPDKGNIFVKGNKVKISSPKNAMSFNIGMVHQHFMLVGKFNAVENVIMVSKEPSFSLLHKKEVKAKLEQIKKDYDIDVDLDCPCEKLSISMQQKVEILKLLYQGAEILILDEPTAVLLPTESEALFKIIRNMTSLNKGVIFISHKLDEVLEISNRINVLSHGKITGEINTKDADKDTIVTMMSGKDALVNNEFDKQGIKGEEIFSLEKVKAYDERKVMTLNGLDLKIYRNEIVGIAGVEGNGQEELAQILSGCKKVSEGKVIYKGNDFTSLDTNTFIKNKIAYIPSDRNNTGTVSDFKLFQNWNLRKKNNHLLNNKKLKEETSKAMEEYDVRAKDYNVRSANLSGGNLQKFILARELERKPDVLICCYPTRGLDIKASYFIRKKLVEAKKDSTAVALFTSDLDELFAIADRIVVLNGGKIVGQRKCRETNPKEIISMMIGANNEKDI